MIANNYHQERICQNFRYVSGTDNGSVWEEWSDLNNSSDYEGYFQKVKVYLVRYLYRLSSKHMRVLYLE